MSDTQQPVSDDEFSVDDVQKSIATYRMVTGSETENKDDMKRGLSDPDLPDREVYIVFKRSMPADLEHIRQADHSAHIKWLTNLTYKHQELFHCELLIACGCQGPDDCQWRMTDEEMAQRRGPERQHGYRRAEDHNALGHWVHVSMVLRGFRWYLDEDFESNITPDGRPEFEAFRLLTLTEDQYQSVMNMIRLLREQSTAKTVKEQSKLQYDYSSLYCLMGKQACTFGSCKPSCEYPCAPITRDDIIPVTRNNQNASFFGHHYVIPSKFFCVSLTLTILGNAGVAIFDSLPVTTTTTMELYAFCLGHNGLFSHVTDLTSLTLRFPLFLDKIGAVFPIRSGKKLKKRVVDMQ